MTYSEARVTRITILALIGIGTGLTQDPESLAQNELRGFRVEPPTTAWVQAVATKVTATVT